jgi:hypothetical protein
MRIQKPSAAGRVLLGISITVGISIGTAACTDLTSLTQVNPGQVSAATLYVPSNAQLLVNGAISDFECAYTRYVIGSGLLIDELSNAIGSSANFDYDARRLLTNASYGTATSAANQQPAIYSTLSTARGSADTVLARLREWTDASMPAGVSRIKLVGQAAAYAGYSLLLLGEGMCAGAVNLSAEMTSAQLFEEAKTRFDAAVEAATTASDAPTLNFALLGRARTLLNLKQAAAAGVDAAKIPPTFIASTGTDNVTVRRQNFAFLSINQNNWNTVDATFRGLTINGAPDPRVAVTNTGRNGTAVGTVVWTPDKYPLITTATPIARYAEAQLIVAESKQAAGDLAGAAAAINTVRATRTGVPAYDATGQSSAQVLATIVEDRRRELFLEGHRLGDLRRYAIPLNPAAGVAYPGGGGVYGTQSCFPLPDVERINNPNIAK